MMRCIMCLEFDPRWDGLLAAHGDLHDAMYGEQNVAKAMRLGRVLAETLTDFSEVSQTAFGWECRALIAESVRDWPRVASCRREEIRQIENQIAENGGSGLCAIGPGMRVWTYSHEDLSASLDLLAIAEWELGNLMVALSVLDASEKVCIDHRLAFDGDDLRSDITRELERQRAATPAVHRRGRPQ